MFPLGIWLLFLSLDPLNFILGWLSGKESACKEEKQIRSLGPKDPLEEEVATHSSILAGEIPWTEEPGGLQSIGSQRVGHNWETEPD